MKKLKRLCFLILFATGLINLSFTAPICVDDGYHANIADCNTYWLCYDGNAILQYCAYNLEWNDVTHQCDYPEDAGCEEVTPPNPEAINGIPSVKMCDLRVGSFGYGVVCENTPYSRPGCVKTCNDPI